ncbi:MAG: helix-turn-helix transcriptional regulator [Tannerella sp.]|jgi:DNA-binding CsgD family transcriptional regulator|nr:helix-turn-helix transcriptional regulator [Tannerella sp.]
MDEIAKQLGITADTVNFHRKNLFNKLDVKNMAEASLFAANTKKI